MTLDQMVLYNIKDRPRLGRSFGDKARLFLVCFFFGFSFDLVYLVKSAAGFLHGCGCAYASTLKLDGNLFGDLALKDELYLSIGA